MDNYNNYQQDYNQGYNNQGYDPYGGYPQQPQQKSIKGLKIMIIILAVILGALSAILIDRYLEGPDKMDFDRAFEEAIIDCFNNKPEVIKMNLCAFYEGKKAVTFPA